MRQTYIIKTHPTNNMFYVFGHCGGKYWMQMSDGFTVRSGAEAWIIRQLKADASAKSELLYFDGKSE